MLRSFEVVLKFIGDGDFNPFRFYPDKTARDPTHDLQKEGVDRWLLLFMDLFEVAELAWISALSWAPLRLGTYSSRACNKTAVTHPVLW